MGQYLASVTIEFNGTQEDKENFRNVLRPLCDEDDDDGFLELTVVEDVAGYYYDEITEDMDKAPILFASLFPNITFTYSFSMSYSVGGDNTEYRAYYKDGKLISKYFWCNGVDDDIEDDIKELPYEEMIEVILERDEGNELKLKKDLVYDESFFEDKDPMKYFYDIDLDEFDEDEDDYDEDDE